MNFSARQWILAFVLDVLIKCVVVVYVDLAGTLSGVPVADLVVLAFPLSLFNFFWLFLASLLARSLARLGLGSASTARFLILTVANAAIVMIIAISTHTAGETWLSLDSGFAIGVALIVTNILPIVIVAAGDGSLIVAGERAANPPSARACRAGSMSWFSSRS
jgi:hypothetical protein